MRTTSVSTLRALAQWIREQWRRQHDVPRAQDQGIGYVVAGFDTDEAAIRMAIAQGYGISRSRNLHADTLRQVR